MGQRTFQVRGETVTHSFLTIGDVVAVLARDPQGQVLLVRQYRAALDRRTLEVPAGYCEPGEAPADAARRELEEETGYRAGRLELLWSFWPAPGYSSEVIHIFAASELRPGQTRFDRGEDLELVRLTDAQCVQALQDGTIRDGKSLVALMAAALGWRQRQLPSGDAV